MKSTGQVDHEDEISDMDRTLQELFNNLEDDKINLARSATARQEFADRVVITRNSMEECKKQSSALEEVDLTSEAKLDKCQVRLHHFSWEL